MRISELEVLSELRSGRLVQVLADFEVSTNAAVWALYPSAKHVLPRMRVLLDFLANWFREARSEERVRPAEARCGRAAPPRPAPTAAQAALLADACGVSGRTDHRAASRSSMRRTATTCGPLRVRYSRPV